MYTPYPPIGIVFLGDIASNPVCFGGSGKQTLHKNNYFIKIFEPANSNEL